MSLIPRIQVVAPLRIRYPDAGVKGKRLNQRPKGHGGHPRKGIDEHQPNRKQQQIVQDLQKVQQAPLYTNPEQKALGILDFFWRVGLCQVKRGILFHA